MERNHTNHLIHLTVNVRYMQRAKFSAKHLYLIPFLSTLRSSQSPISLFTIPIFFSFASCLLANALSVQDVRSFYQNSCDSRIQLLLNRRLGRLVSCRSGCDYELMREVVRAFNSLPAVGNACGVCIVYIYAIQR